MEQKDYSDLDKILEQCTWVNTFDDQGDKTLRFFPNGEIIYFKNNPGYLSNYKTIKANSNEAIYESYLAGIEVSKERAYVNCIKSGIFEHHALMRQMYWKLGKKVKNYLEKYYPELLI